MINTEKITLEQRVELKSVIRIIDQDILDAMAYTLYGLKCQEALDSNEKQYSDFVENMITCLTTKKEYNFLAFDSHEDQQRYELQISFELFNNWNDRYFLTDMFLVTEVYDEYFKIGLLNEFDRDKFLRVGKLNNMYLFLKSLKFPYTDRNKTFWKMACAF